MRYTYTNNPIDDSADAAANSIKQHLDNGEKVLWLLSGGSGIEIAIKASQRLKGHDLSNLFISLTDERYGKISHKDENWQQLLNHGLLVSNAQTYRPLINQDINTTTREFNSWMKLKFEEADYIVGIFGMGADGHTAGIKPFNQNILSDDMTYSYSGPDFERVTISLKAIKQISEVIVQISGDNKKPQLHKLINSDISTEEQPAQIFKQTRKTTIYSNIKKEEIA